MLDRSNPDWLLPIIDCATRENWCVRIGCTTCPSVELRRALALLDDVGARWVILPLSETAAAEIVAGLTRWPGGAGAEQTVRWLLFEVWRHFDDRLLTPLAGTPAGAVLSRMREHYAERLEARRVHDARQGVR
jgi:hypothetical protein